MVGVAVSREGGDDVAEEVVDGVVGSFGQLDNGGGGDVNDVSRERGGISNIRMSKIMTSKIKIIK